MIKKRLGLFCSALFVSSSRWRCCSRSCSSSSSSSSSCHLQGRQQQQQQPRRRREEIFRKSQSLLFSSSSASTFSMFDAVKGFFTGGGKKEMELPPETFTLKELVEMFAKAEEEGTDAGVVNSGFGKIGLDAKQLKKICSFMTEEELIDPTSVGKRTTRLNEVAKLCEDDEITSDKVKRVILAHATTKLMFGKIRKAVLNGASLPKSVADFENIVRDLQKSGDMKQEARNLKGAYSNNSPCPCNSGKRFKRCCGS